MPFDIHTWNYEFRTSCFRHDCLISYEI